MVNHLQVKTNKPANGLRSHRRALDITQKDLASKVGIDQTYYSMIERGTKIPRVNLAWRICLALNTTLEEVFPVEIFSIDKESAHAIDHS